MKTQGTASTINYPGLALGPDQNRLTGRGVQIRSGPGPTKASSTDSGREYQEEVVRWSGGEYQEESINKA